MRNGISATSHDESHLRARGRSQTVQRISRPSLDCFDQRRVDIGLAAHRRRVAERLRDRLDHRCDADPGVLGLVEHLFERQDGRAPSAEMLRREVAVRRLADIVVDLA